MILSMHNKLRNSIAGGKEKGFKPAKRMATMKWHPVLAKLAEYNVKRCLYQRDECHKTEEFPYSGQSRTKEMSRVQSSSQSAKKNVMGRTTKQVLQSFTDAWNEQMAKCKMSYIDKYPKKPSG